MAFDLSDVATGLKTWSGQVLNKMVTDWTVQQDVFVHRSVTTPIGLPKISAGGNPRPYRTAEDMTDPVIADRKLTVNQTKWDYSADFEDLRNQYMNASTNGLLDPNSTPWTKWIAEQYMAEYLDSIQMNVIGSGNYNASGSAAADMADGFLTLIADEITALNLTAIVVGATSTANAVTKVETFIAGFPMWMKQKGFKIFCSYNEFDKYRTHYRTLNGYGFNKNDNAYKIDGYNGTLEPRAWMGTSARLIAVPNIPTSSFNYPLHLGTNDGAIAIYPTISLNVLKVRMTFPLGLQISDLDAIQVNDQA
jgi:hypothetical protein